MHEKTDKFAKLESWMLTISGIYLNFHMEKV